MRSLKMKTLSIILILILGLSAFGQSRKPLPKTKTPAAKPIAEPVSEAAKISTVQITAGLIFDKNDLVPVAGNTFFLLSEDLAAVLSTRKMKELKYDDADNSYYDPPELSDAQLRKDDLITIIRRMQSGYFPTFTAAAKEAIVKAVKFRAVSDAQGKAEFKNLPPGKYFLFGECRIRTTAATWYIPVNANGELIKINLGLNNKLPL